VPPYVVDHFEGEFAVLENDDGTILTVGRCLLPANAREGDVLVAASGSGINPFALDEKATEDRLAVARKLVEALRRGPDGEWL